MGMSERAWQVSGGSQLILNFWEVGAVEVLLTLLVLVIQHGVQILISPLVVRGIPFSGSFCLL